MGWIRRVLIMPIIDNTSVFIARFRIDPAKLDRFRAAHGAIMERSAAYIEAQSHFVFFGFGRQSHEFVAIECWKDQEVLTTLRLDPGFQAGVCAMLDCCTAPIEIELYAGQTGNKSVFDLYPRGPSAFHPTSNGQHVEFR